MALQLITEARYDVRTLVEAKEQGSPSYFIEGIFMQGNIKNQNGRVYPTETLAKEVKRYTTEYIDRKRAFSELGHPTSPSVNLDRVSHLITAIQQNGDEFIGRAKVTIHTPMGNIVKALIDEGAELGVSTRGLGTLSETENGMEVQDDFYLAAVDIVADPSAPDAFVRGIMEGKAWVWDGGILRESALDTIVKTIEEVSIPTVNEERKAEVFIAAYKTFLTALSEGVQPKVR